MVKWSISAIYVNSLHISKYRFEICSFDSCFFKFHIRFTYHIVYQSKSSINTTLNLETNSTTYDGSLKIPALMLIKEKRRSPFCPRFRFCFLIREVKTYIAESMHNGVNLYDFFLSDDQRNVRF